MVEFDFCLDEIIVAFSSRHTVCCFFGRWESTGGEEMLNETIFFVPSFPEPQFEFSSIIKWDILNGKATPVHVDRWRWPTLKVHGAEGEEVLAEFSSSDLFSYVRKVR